MTLQDGKWGNRGHCPRCGRWCSAITGWGGEEEGLRRVTGICKVHGEVDLSKQDWSYDDFFKEMEAA